MPAEKIYTDGCGFMNRAGLIAIARMMGYTEPPTAVQGRIFGSKGLWVLHPLDHHSVDGHPPMIWIRPSQQKVHLVSLLHSEDMAGIHPAHFIFDLVAPSRVTVATRLSRLTVLNFAHNGVPKSAFVRLMKDGLDREVSPLVQWDGPNAMSVLWYGVNKSTGASTQRIQHYLSSLQRAIGLSRRRDVEDETEEVAQGL